MRRSKKSRTSALRRASEVKPETIRQARRWEKVKQTYMDEVGLCEKCAAMAAWGHQVGFSLADPPCSVCLPLLRFARLTREEPHGWRVFRKVS